MSHPCLHSIHMRHLAERHIGSLTTSHPVLTFTVVVPTLYLFTPTTPMLLFTSHTCSHISKINISIKEPKNHHHRWKGEKHNYKTVHSLIWRNIHISQYILKTWSIFRKRTNWLRTSWLTLSSLFDLSWNPNCTISPYVFLANLCDSQCYHHPHTQLLRHWILGEVRESTMGHSVLWVWALDPIAYV